MKHRCSFRFLPALIAVAWVWQVSISTALAATPAMLIGPDLKPRLVNLQAMGGGRMTYFDDQRNMQVESTSDVLQIRFPLQSDSGKTAGLEGQPVLDMTDILITAKAGPPVAFVELISGQRIVAAFSGAKADGQTLLFKHDLMGELALALDQVARLSFEGTMASSATPTSDQVLLINGDVVTGFVVSVKEAGIEVQQGEAKPFTLPRDRVKALHLANPVKRDAGKASMIWLRDGSRLLASEVSISADKLTFICPLTGKDAVMIDLKQIARIELASPAGQLIDLADLPMSVTAGGKVFGLAMAPRIEGSAIHLHAPITVTFALPAKATRFAALAQLDATGENASLAHFIINITTASSPAARHVISSQSPHAGINAPLTGRDLIINLDPANNGPVLDRLKLTDAVIFVER